MRTEQEGGRRSAMERPQEKQTCPHLDLRLLSSRTVQTTQSAVLCYGSPSKLIHELHTLLVYIVYTAPMARKLPVSGQEMSDKILSKINLRASLLLL